MQQNHERYPYEKFAGLTIVERISIVWETRAAIEVHHFFFLRFGQFRSLRSLPKTDFGEK